MAVTLFRNNERTDYYHFQAATLADAEARMSQLGPHDAEGNHAAAFDVRANIMDGLSVGPVAGQTTTLQVPGSPPAWMATAQIVSATLRYQVVYTFPDWTDVAARSTAVQAEWTRYTAALWQHERGHAQSMTPVLDDYRGQFERLRISAQGSSGQAAETAAQRELRTQVQEVYNLLTGAAQDNIRAYDRRTNHGRGQGARLNTRIR